MQTGSSWIHTLCLSHSAMAYNALPTLWIATVFTFLRQTSVDSFVFVKIAKLFFLECTLCVCLLVALYFKLHYTLNYEMSNGLATILTSKDISHLVHFITNFNPDGRIHLPKLCLNH